MAIKLRVAYLLATVVYGLFMYTSMYVRVALLSYSDVRFRYTSGVPTGWRTSYSWRKLATVAILSYK